MLILKDDMLMGAYFFSCPYFLHFNGNIVCKVHIILRCAYYWGDLICRCIQHLGSGIEIEVHGDKKFGQHFLGSFHH